MSNPYGLTDEQLRAYSAQIDEERATRAAMPRERINWRELFEDDDLAVAYLKHGTVPIPPKRQEA